MNLRIELNKITTIHNSNEKQVKYGKNNLIELTGNAEPFELIDSPSGKKCVMYQSVFKHAENDIYNNFRGDLFTESKFKNFKILDSKNNRYSLKCEDFRFVVDKNKVKDFNSNIINKIDNIGHSKENICVFEGRISEGDRVHIFGSVDFSNKYGENIIEPSFEKSAILSTKSKDRLKKELILSIMKKSFSIIFMSLLCISIVLYRFQII